jgi:DNA-binding CsgD family transcriptional regulator
MADGTRSGHPLACAAMQRDPNGGGRLELLERLLEPRGAVGGWEFDLRSGKTRWTAGLHRMLDLPATPEPRSQAEVLAQVHPGDRDRVRAMFAAMTGRAHDGDGNGNGDGDGIELEVRLLRRDGSACEVRTLGRIETDAEARPVRWTGVVLDAGESLPCERELPGPPALSRALREWRAFELSTSELLGRVGGALGYPVALLWRWDRNARALVLRAEWAAEGAHPRALERARGEVAFREGDGKAGVLWPTRGPVVTTDVAAGTGPGTVAAVAFHSADAEAPVSVLSLHTPERRPSSTDLVRALTALARELGRSLNQERRARPQRALSQRELEVLSLAAEGLSGPAIATELVLSPATVKTHFEHIYEKLGVADRTAAVAQAIRTGLID